MKHKKMFLLSHLVVGICVLTLLLSGFRIASQQRDFWLNFDWLLPQGLVHIWHVIAGVLLLTSLPFMLIVLLKQRNESPITKVLNQIGSILICVSVVTGVWQFFFEFTHIVVRFIHYYSALGILVFIALHPLRYYFQKSVKYLVHVIFEPLTYKRSYFYLGTFFLASSSLYLITLSTPETLQSHGKDCLKQRQRYIGLHHAGIHALLCLVGIVLMVSWYRVVSEVQKKLSPRGQR